MQKQISIDIEKKYSFPENIAIIKHGEVYLAITVDTGNWIVLDNEAQLEFFSLLQENSISESLQLFQGKEDDAKWVLIQIEARKLYSNHCVAFKENICMIYLTNGCNLRCPHCFISAGDTRKDELSTPELESLISDLANFGISDVTFSGGEISLRSDLSHIIRYTSSKNISVKLLTNGVLWTQQLVDELASMIDSVQISIDGYSESENAKIRGAGNFAKALHTVDMFLKKGVKTQIAITPYPSDTLPEKVSYYADFAKSLKKKYNNSHNLKIVFTSGIMDGRELTLTQEQRESYRDTMNNVMKEYLNEDARDYPFILDHQQRKIMTNCSYGCLNISSEGDVYICSRAGLKPVANIRSTTMQKIMDISKQASALSEINNLEPCRNCHLKYICGGGCRVDEFPSLRSGPAFLEKRPTRTCNETIKNEFYDLMVRTNQAIFQ